MMYLVKVVTHEWDETKFPQLGLERETSLTKESGNAPTYTHKVSQIRQIILHVMQWWLGQYKNLSDLRKMMTERIVEMKNCDTVPIYLCGVAPHFIWMNGKELAPFFFREGNCPHVLWILWDIWKNWKVENLPQVWILWVCMKYMDELDDEELPQIWILWWNPFVGMNDMEAALIFGFTDRQEEYACNE